MATVRRPAEKPDIALGRTIRAHLRLGPHPGSAVRVAARGGAITLSGETRSLARKRKILATTAAVPGVTKIYSADLRVANRGVPDSTIARDIRTVARRMSEIDPKMLSISVQSGHVELRSSIPSRAQFQDLLELVENVRGVRSLRFEVEATARPSAADHLVRKWLRRAVTALFPEEKIEISVFKGVVVLSGSVRSLAVKQGIERLATRDDAVQRIVNKLEVSGR